VGRFVTEDPVREGGNWYGYAGADPATATDPSGLGCWDKGFNDPSCWYYQMMQRQTWCQTNWYYCYMHGYLRCFWHCFPKRLVQPVLVVSATWLAAYHQLMSVQQELNNIQANIGEYATLTGVALSQIYERIALLRQQVMNLQTVLRTIPRWTSVTVIVWETICVWKCYGSS